jgi:hypothetical protein
MILNSWARAGSGKKKRTSKIEPSKDIRLCMTPSFSDFYTPPAPIWQTLFAKAFFLLTMSAFFVDKILSGITNG